MKKMPIPNKAVAFMGAEVKTRISVLWRNVADNNSPRG